MLVLSRKIGEMITIGNTIKITVLGYDRGFVKIGIEAPSSVPVHRKEVYDKIIEMNRQAAMTEISSLKNALQSTGLLASIQSGAIGDLESHNIPTSADEEANFE